MFSIYKAKKAWFEWQRPIIALAPLADYTDSPFCRICREVSGDKFIVFREMVSSEAIVRGNEKTMKMCEFDDVERPIVLQIFGSDPAVMAKAAKIIVDKFKPDGIDINMGCPVPKVTGKVNAGASLMKDHDRAAAIVKAIKAMNLAVPVSVKTRLGWSKEDEILEFAPKLEQAGADLFTIHGRTKIQGYSGKANWEMIAKAKRLLTIPVIANGDVNSAEDVKRCLEITKADGVMIGRGALGNPWILKNILSSRGGAERRRGISVANKNGQRSLAFARDDIFAIIARHAEYHLEHYGERGIVTFRKHLAWYFKSNRMAEIKNIKELRKKLVKVNSLFDLQNLLEDI